MASLTTSFATLIVATLTSFTGSIAEMPIAPAPEESQTIVRNNVDVASGISSSAAMTSGIAVIDRATGNSMTTNGNDAHRQFSLETLGRLPILFYAVRTDSSVAKGKVPDIISMMEGVSGEATNRVWEKYGGDSIIIDTSKRYNLQETKPGDSWKTTQSTAVDVARMIRRFFDDKNVTLKEKRWVAKMMSRSPLSVAGEDFSFGLPSAAGIKDTSEKKGSETTLLWAQGWSNTGKDPMVRHSAGLWGSGMRFITVILGQVPKDTSNNEANRISSQVATSLLNGNGEKAKPLENYGSGTTAVETYIEYMDKRFPRGES